MRLHPARFLRRLVALFTWSARDRDIDQEMGFHLESMKREGMRSGQSEAEAERTARRRFGNVLRIKEQAHDVLSVRVLEEFGRDVRIGGRTLRRRPGFAVSVIMTLAVGIGANVAVFSAVNALLLSELPTPEPHRVVKVYTSGSSGAPHGESSYPDFADYRDLATSFEDLAAYSTSLPMNLGVGDSAERILGAVATRNFFEVLGFQPALGGFFPPGIDTALNSAPVTVLSYELWQRRFGGSPGVVGREVAINGSVFTVIGVAPEGFRGVELTSDSALWVPMSMVERAEPRRAGSDLFNRRGSRGLKVVGRLASHATLETARAELTTLAEQLAQAHPDTNLGTRRDPDHARPVSVLPARAVDEAVFSQVALLLMTAVGVVLLITCANIANLLLARATTRQREIALRRALGASRGRLLRQLLTESSLLASLGGLAGLLLAVWSIQLLPSLFQTRGTLPAFSLDWRVLVFTTGLSLVTGVLFGLAPALQSVRPDLMPTLKDAPNDGRRPRARLQGALVIAQVALSLVLLIGAGLFVRSLRTALATDPGFNSAGVLLADLDLSLQGYDETRGLNFYASLIERVGGLPGVETVSVAAVVPVNPAGSREDVEVEGYAPRPREDMALSFNRVSPDYFRTMGISVVQGRVFSDAGPASASREVVVNQTFARRYWPAQDPIGRSIRIGDSSSEAYRVVGVVQDGKYRNIREAGLPYIYLPISLSYTPRVTLLARTAGDPLALLPSVRAELRALDSTLPIYGERTLDAQLAGAVSRERQIALPFIVFGSIALLLAAIGIYGVVAHGVRQRTSEIGLRMALGADRQNVVRLVVGRGMRLALVGVGLGLVGAFFLARVVAALLFEISPIDATTFALVPVGLLAVALVACLLPARLATRIDPIAALRSD